MKIIDFVRALLPRIEKDKLLEDMRVTIGELDQVVIPSYQSSADYFKQHKLQANDSKDLSDSFYRNYDRRGGKQASFINEIALVMPNVKQNAAYVQKLIEELMEHDIINEGLTAKKAILVRAAEMFSFVSRYSVDLLNYVYVQEANEAGADVEESLQLCPAAVKHVTVHIAKFAAILSDYGIPNTEFDKLISNVPDVIVNSKTVNSIKGLYKEIDIDPFSSSYIVSFTGNPIYHIRLMIAEWQANRYKSQKEKKKMLELRLLHLKLSQEKKSNPKIQQEIEYIQGRVDRIERYLKDVEESLDDKE